MTTNPLPCRFVVGGHSVTDQTRLHISRYAGGLSTGLSNSAGGLSLYWLTPDLLYSALRRSVTRVARMAIAGTFVGSYSLRSGREVGEHGAGRREVSRLDMLIEGTASSVRLQLNGELHQETNTRPCASPLSTQLFEVELAVPLTELENAIQDADAKPLAEKITSLLSKPSGLLTG